jgi:hypothetical protein
MLVLLLRIFTGNKIVSVYVFVGYHRNGKVSQFYKTSKHRSRLALKPMYEKEPDGSRCAKFDVNR